MMIWEIGEPTIFSNRGVVPWRPYQSRDNYEDGMKGIIFDIETGLRGYDDGDELWDDIWYFWYPILDPENYP